VASAALVGQPQRVSGSLGTAHAGDVVVIQARGARDGAWAAIATARAGDDGSFRASWRTNAVGRWTIRAIASGAASAAVNEAIAPTTTASVYRAAGATWYSLPGNTTACGIRLQRSTLGVAHRTLPCGTRVDITWGGRSVTVPVIDRGPFVRGVHYDLTLAAARVLGFVAAGRVRVGVLPERAATSPGTPAAAVPPALAAPGGIAR
jgi:rare lipoprotein A (peptidoglycan hydrolase)